MLVSLLELHALQTLFHMILVANEDQWGLPCGAKAYIKKCFNLIRMFFNNRHQLQYPDSGESLKKETRRDRTNGKMEI
jgi:hypothetical protein